MSESTTELELLLRGNRWREANDRTRLLLADRQLDAGILRKLDRSWSSCSEGKFGFLEQRRTWTSLGGPSLLSGFDLWEFFHAFGDQVGWRRDGRWLSWKGVVATPALQLHVLDEADIPLKVPRGCLPFHDVMSSGEWSREFSPRDCWGEHVWDRWAEVLGQFEE
jgi:hypothetical protein